MSQNNQDHSVKFKYFNFIFLITTTIYTFIFGNLFFLSTFGADYEKYKNYLEYFFSSRNSSDLEQSPLYYFLVSFILNFRSNRISPDNLLYEITFSIQLTNLILIIIGFIGLYKLLKEYEVSSHKSLIILNLLNIFPPLVSLKLTMKPEVLVFSFITWVIYFIQKFNKTNKIAYLFISIPPVILILSSKGSALGIYSIFIIFLIYKHLNKIKLRSLMILLIVFIVLFSGITYENSNINSNILIDLEVSEKYNNKAGLDILFRNNAGDKQSLLFLNFDKNTIFGITTLDTFGDYFKLYWNKDASLFNKYEKQLFVESSNTALPKIDLKNRNILISESYPNAFRDLRTVTAIAFTIIFYFCMIKFSLSKKAYRTYLLSPLIGIFILYINSLGIPSPNFDPFTADTFKTFYYSPLLVVSFSFVSLHLFKKSNVLISVFCIFYILGSIFIFGFPKQDGSAYLSEIEDMNRHNVICEINKYIIHDISNESNCSNKLATFCDYQQNRLNLNIYTNNNYEEDISGFIIKKYISSLEQTGEGSKACKEITKFQSLIDHSKIPYFNLLLMLLFFYLIVYEKKYISKV